MLIAKALPSTRQSARSFGFTSTLSYRLYGPKRTVMVIHPLLQARSRSRLDHLLEADEALGLARAAKFDILPGPSQPRMGWDNERITARLMPTENSVQGYVTVQDSDVESDDEMDMDDPLWNDNSIRKQFVESAIVRLDRIDPVWFFGQGKVEEIAITISKMPPRYVFVNAMLSHTQIKQLEESFFGGLLSYLSAKKQEYLETSRAKQMVGYRGDDEADKYEQRISTYLPKSIEVFDRSRMILEIFARRANSPIAKLQCDIAKMHFTKVNLGVGNLRRAREVMNTLHTTVTPFRETRKTVDEGVKVDNSGYSFSEHKEKVDVLLRKLKRKMDDAKRNKERQRNTRSGNHVTIGIVGYTNAGKTQLMNQLVPGGNLRVRDLLFQTLDSSTRTVDLPNGTSVHITDSIGFIRDLPHFLFHAFKATIDDIISCDFLLHVRDISHPLSAQQAETVLGTLMDAGFTRRDIEERVIEVWNKIDEVNSDQLGSMLQDQPQVVPVSALTGEGVSQLIDILQKVSSSISKVSRKKLVFPLSELKDRMHILREITDVVYEESLDCDETGELMSVEVMIRPEALAKYTAHFNAIE